MVVDFDKFTPGGPLPEKDLLWIAEQIPGTVGVKDVTSVLTRQGFWPSYNVPYLEEIYTKSGLPTTGENTYENASRALIFKRDGKPQRSAPTEEILSKGREPTRLSTAPKVSPKTLKPVTDSIDSLPIAMTSEGNTGPELKSKEDSKRPAFPSLDSCPRATSIEEFTSPLAS